MLKTNRANLVMMAVQGKVVNPGAMRIPGVDAEGTPFLLPGTGGIVYNVKVGDPAFGWQADHIEPCASTILDEKKRYERPNAGYVFYSCVGNEAKIVSGDVKGKKGVVTGHHGGAETVEHLVGPLGMFRDGRVQPDERVAQVLLHEDFLRLAR